MINPAELVDNLVALLRAIPDLVAEMGGDEQRIIAYHDQYPKRASLAAAIHDMPAPGLMAAWQGTTPGSFGGVDVWKHQVSPTATRWTSTRWSRRSSTRATGAR